MNKKDCEHIGYLLSITRNLEEFKENLFRMDARIEPEFIAFEEIQGRSEKVDKRADEIMYERNADVPGIKTFGWAIVKQNYLKFTYKEALEHARKEIYGDDYHPSLFKQ